MQIPQRLQRFDSITEATSLEEMLAAVKMNREVHYRIIQECLGAIDRYSPTHADLIAMERTLTEAIASGPVS